MSKTIQKYVYYILQNSQQNEHSKMSKCLIDSQIKWGRGEIEQ